MKISIVTICYNCITDLKETMASIQKKKIEGIESIVVDGNSQDGTADYLKSQDITDRYLSEKDEGIYDAMNKGVKLSSGEYILFLNAGDTFHDALNLRHLMQELDRSSPDILYGQAIKRTLNTEKPFALHDINKIKIEMPFCHQASVTKKSILEKNMFDTSFKIAGDYDFFLSEFLRGSKFAKWDNLIAIVDSSGVSHTSKFSSTLERIRSLAKNEVLSTRLCLQYSGRLLKSGLSDLLFKLNIRETL